MIEEGYPFNKGAYLECQENRKRVFDWNNLFYVCPHCNKVKKSKKYDEKILDCCECDPEIMLEQMYIEGHVLVHNITDEETARMTADLIQNCYEKKNTGIREAACQHRVDALAESMRYRRSLCAMLDRKSKFAAFKRYYVRQHLDVYPKLKDFV